MSSAFIHSIHQLPFMEQRARDCSGQGEEVNEVPSTDGADVLLKDIKTMHVK